MIREDVLPGLDLTVTAAANQLGVSRVALSRVINGRTAISAEMAIRFAQWLGGSAETWLRAQAQFDLWHAGREKRIRVKPVHRAAVTPELVWDKRPKTRIIIRRSIQELR